MAARQPSARRRRRRTPVTVQVKILPKDPLVAREQGLWPLETSLSIATAHDGPTSARVAVIDYNADLDTRFASAKALKNGKGFHGIARLRHNRILDDFNFHQVNAWAIVEQILTKMEGEYALARPIPWASGLGRLLILPHAGYQENAFYDRGTGALHLFYFEGLDGKPVYTCLSHDIVAHELGHAILDGLKPGYNEISSPETAGFHEYFGDAVAMMSSLDIDEIARIVTKGAPARLSARNLVSAIASEFGAAIHRLPDEAYLRGAWNNRKMGDLRGTFEEHDWSEILTGAYYDLLEYLYRHQLQSKDDGLGLEGVRGVGERQRRCIQALFGAANKTSNIMLRAIDYCPPVDLRYEEYARAVIRADEVAYPTDPLGVRSQLRRIFRRRQIRLTNENTEARDRTIYELRATADIDAITATPADAYRFLDQYRALFGIPADANLQVPSVYRTNKRAKSGYRPPKERVIEFTWSDDVRLEGKRFGSLAGGFLPLYCGGTLVFDGNGNFLHNSLVLPTPQRRRALLAYTAFLVRDGRIGVIDGARGIGAPGIDSYPVRAILEGNRVRLERNAAMRHGRPGDSHP